MSDEPTTQAGRDLLTAIKGALLDPALSSFLGSTGKPELVAIVSLPLLERVIPDIEREAAAAERERLRKAVEQAESDLLAYGHHLEGEIVYRGADWQAHRLPGETCRCGLDAAIARVHAALEGKPQGERARRALAPAAPVQEDSHETR